MAGGGASASKETEEVSRTSGTDGAGGVHVDIGIEGDRVGGEEIIGGRGRRRWRWQ